MYKLARSEAKEKYWLGDDMRGFLLGSIFSLLSMYTLSRNSGNIEIAHIILSLVVSVFCLYLIYWYGLGWLLSKRMYRVGFLNLTISYNNGTVSVKRAGVEEEILCVNVVSLERPQHNLHFNCYARFSKVWNAVTNEIIISNNKNLLSFAPGTSSSYPLQYGNIPDGENVIYFAKVENETLVLFSSTTKLISLSPGEYNVDIVLGGICMELDRCIRPVKFKGKITFDGTRAQLEKRKFSLF